MSFSKSGGIFFFFAEFWLSFSKTVDLEKSYIPLNKALNSGKWIQFWNWKNFGPERLQANFSKRAGFSIMWTWQPLEWYHAQCFHDSKSSLLVFSSDMSFVWEFFWKGDENFKSLKSGPIYMEDPVVFIHMFRCYKSPTKNLQRETTNNNEYPTYFGCKYCAY